MFKSKNMLGYNFVKSNIGSDGIGYMCFDLEPEKLDEHDLINGVRAVDVTHDHKKQQTTISTFTWIHGAPHNWNVLKTIKDEIVEEVEIPAWLDKLGLIILRQEEDKP